jgi:hypothetical protein
MVGCSESEDRGGTRILDDRPSRLRGRAAGVAQSMW